MTDVLRVKRRATGGAAGAPTTAQVGQSELAYNEVDDTFWIGKGGTPSAAASVVKLGGIGNFLQLTGGTLSGVLNMAATYGITFASAPVSGAILTSHLQLHSAGYGINVVPSTIQLVAGGVVALGATTGAVLIPLNLNVTGSSTHTGLATFNGGLTSTAGITVSGSNSSFTTPTAFTGGITFGSNIATGVDLSKHIALWGNSYGMNVISATVQIVANGNVSLQATGAAVTVPGNFNVTGSSTHTGQGIFNGGLTANAGPLLVNANYGNIIPSGGSTAICWNMTGGQRDMDFVNTFATSARSFHFYQQTTATPAAWAANTAYAVNAVVFNSPNVYTCTVAGTSAASGGPTGTGSGIVDNTVTWNYVSGIVPYTQTLLLWMNTTQATFNAAVSVGGNLSVTGTSTLTGLLTANGGVFTGNTYATNSGDFTHAGILFYGAGATACGFNVTGTPAVLNCVVAGATVYTAAVAGFTVNQPATIAGLLTANGGVTSTAGLALTTGGTFTTTSAVATTFNGGVTAAGGLALTTTGTFTVGAAVPTTFSGTINSIALATFNNIQVTGGLWQGTPVAVAYGGTGAATASAALTNLGAAALAGATFTGAVTTNALLTANGGISTGNTYAASSGDFTNAGILFYGAGATACGFNVTGAPSVLNCIVAGATVYTAAVTGFMVNQP